VDSLERMSFQNNVFFLVSPYFPLFVWMLIRLVIGIVYYLDLWYCPVYTVVTLGTFFWKTRIDIGWIMSIISISVFPFIQYVRCHIGFKVARKFDTWVCCWLSLISVPVFLIQLLLFSHQDTRLVVDRTAGIIALSLSFIEATLTTLLFIRNHSWSACTPVSLLHLTAVGGSLAVLIITLFIYCVHCLIFLTSILIVWYVCS
jgi:hypothetical protein